MSGLMPEILPNWHPIVVHFAIALLLTGAALFAVGAMFAGRPIGEAVTVAARWDLGLGIAVAVIALATGWHAYNSVAHDDASHANMTIHMRWALASVGLFAGAAVLGWADRRRASGAGLPLLVTLIVASGALVVTGWLGGENVYRYGLGVASLPKADGHHHHHHHDDGDAPDDDHDHAAPASVPAAPSGTAK